MRFKCIENHGVQTVDVILTTVPYTHTVMPLMAPAALKPAIEKAGMTSLCVDLNIEVHHLIEKHKDRSALRDFFFQGTTTESTEAWVDALCITIAKQLLSWNPKYIGLSLLTYASRSTCFYICKHVRELSPDTKIIIGGSGCLETFAGAGTFADEMRDLGLVDYHIRGDGEHALYQLLIGNDQYPGINSLTWKEMTNEELEQLPYPNYSNYDFFQYQHRLIGIHGSRGCVRACTFCDYIANWSKFQWRSAENIFGEMLEQYKRYGIRRFKFSDTLTNGNLKEFNKLVRLLADYNTANPEERFFWSGYYIFREQSVNDDEMWDIIARSGASLLAVGIENLNEDVRYHIGKKFSNASIDYHLAQAKKHGIMLILLFIVGYVTETAEHVAFSMKWLEDHVEFKDSIQLNWDQTLAIFPNTHLERNHAKLGVKLGPTPHLWIGIDNKSDQTQRSKWVKRLVKHSKSLGYTVLNRIDGHYYLEEKLRAVSLKNHKKSG